LFYQRECEGIVKFGNFSTEVKWNLGMRKVDIPRICGDNSTAKKELGWQPKTSFEEEITRTIEWFRQE
jgi:nucleoside-diphosphate-sugar epimerase